MKPYIDELVRLRTNNLLKINISGSANENILAERNDLKKSSAISEGLFSLIKLSALLTKYTLSDIIGMNAESEGEKMYLDKWRVAIRNLKNSFFHIKHGSKLFP